MRLSRRPIHVQMLERSCCNEKPIRPPSSNWQSSIDKGEWPIFESRWAARHWSYRSKSGDSARPLKLSSWSCQTLLLSPKTERQFLAVKEGGSRLLLFVDVAREKDLLYSPRKKLSKSLERKRGVMVEQSNGRICRCAVPVCICK